MSEPTSGVILPAQSAGSVPAKRTGKTQWFQDGFYSMQSDSALMRMGTSTDLPPVMRMYLVVAARANRWGHAAFMPQELIGLLDVARPTLNKALRKLIAEAVAAPESTPMCVVLAAELYRRGDRANRTCIEVSHVDRQCNVWSQVIGWENEGLNGDWQGWVELPPAERDRIAQQIEIIRTRTVTETETIRITSGSSPLRAA